MAPHITVYVPHAAGAGLAGILLLAEVMVVAMFEGMRSDVSWAVLSHDLSGGLDLLSRSFWRRSQNGYDLVSGG